MKARWPSRRAARMVRLPAAEVKRMPVSAVATKIAHHEPNVPPVHLVPRQRGHAALAALILLAVLGVLAAMANQTLLQYQAVGLPGRVAVGVIGILTALAALLYLVSLLVYVLPRLVGLRDAPPAHEPPRM